MPKPAEIRKEINRLIGYLVEVGLADDQNFAEERRLTDGSVQIGFLNSDHVSIAMKQLSYSRIYHYMVAERAYSVRMPDGALVQMMYTFGKRSVERHRLAFFPAPHLDEFQNSPDIYLQDEFYADVVARDIVPLSLRFDYDLQDDKHTVIRHPKCHLSLGQYENCRMPVTAPMTPSWFLDFILRNFYHTAFLSYGDGLPKSDSLFDECIHPAERSIVHIQIPLRTVRAG